VDAQQVFGGHGYIREWGMEQYVRDVRIAQIYEGTNGIQALDLMGRKIVRNGGAYAVTYFAEIREFAANMNAANAFLKDALLAAVDKVEATTQAVIERSKTNPDEVNAACVDYLHAFGLLSYAHMFALMTEAANGKDGAFYSNKTLLARFFVTRLLPRLDSHLAAVNAGAAQMMDFEEAYFAQA
jgi:hypothetical protein